MKIKSSNNLIALDAIKAITERIISMPIDIDNEEIDLATMLFEYGMEFDIQELAIEEGLATIMGSSLICEEHFDAYNDLCASLLNIAISQVKSIKAISE